MDETFFYSLRVMLKVWSILSTTKIDLSDSCVVYAEGSEESAKEDADKDGIEHGSQHGETTADKTGKMLY